MFSTAEFGESEGQVLFSAAEDRNIRALCGVAHNQRQGISFRGQIRGIYGAACLTGPSPQTVIHLRQLISLLDNNHVCQLVLVGVLI